MIGKVLVKLFEITWWTILIMLAMSLLNLAVGYELPEDYSQKLRAERKIEEVNSFPVRGYDQAIPEPRRIKGYEARDIETPYSFQNKGLDR